MTFRPSLPPMKIALRQAFALDESLKMKALDDSAFEDVFGEEKSL